jgi:heptosyltransferase-2
MNPERLNCRFLTGYKPCVHHKKSRVPCAECASYSPVTFRIAILKIGAAGEVIRNTPLLRRLRTEYPSAEITWVTDYPDLIPPDQVDRVIKYSWESCQYLLEERFDLLLSLDKEKGPCALANGMKATIKKGFGYSPLGKIVPIDEDSVRKWETGIDDRKMLENGKHYVEETFEICGYEWQGEEYLLPAFERSTLLSRDKFIVGLNTGAGGLWRTRIPNLEKIEEIIRGLIALNHEVVLLGGPDEDAKNRMLKAKFPVHYFGVRPLRDFLNIVDNCDAVITPVTMTLHIAIGLGKRVVLLNNIFNKAEFHLYERGEIIEPPLRCLGCYKKDFDSACPVNDCTLLYDTEKVLQSLVSCSARLGG